MYGSLLCGFLIDGNCCISNGRNSVGNNFTFVGPQRCSVVDYCLVPYECTGLFQNFNVILIADLISDLNIVEKVGPSNLDLSVLRWDVRLSRSPRVFAGQTGRIKYVYTKARN